MLTAERCRPGTPAARSLPDGAGEGPHLAVGLGLADHPPLAVVLVGQERDGPGIGDGHDAMLGVVGVFQERAEDGGRDERVEQSA